MNHSNSDEDAVINTVTVCAEKPMRQQAIDP